MVNNHVNYILHQFLPTVFAIMNSSLAQLFIFASHVHDHQIGISVNPLTVHFGLQKLNERSTMLSKGNFRDGGRGKDQWQAIMTIELMSSDESGEEDGDEILVTIQSPGCLRLLSS